MQGSLSRASILVVAETRDGLPTALTREALALARELADENSGIVAAALISADAGAAQDLIAYGAERVYFCAAQSDEYEGELWLPHVEPIVRALQPAAVLLGHTTAGADLAPRLAFRLESGVAMGCTAVASEEGKLVFTRPCYGGNVREALSINALPAIATLKPGIAAPQPDSSRTGEVLDLAVPELRRRTRVVSRERETAGAARLEDAKVIVAGGRGLEGADGFRVLAELASALDGVVGSSRVPCDLGWCPHSWQIGLTGKTVTPDVYFAVGISGAGHHMAGCGNAKTIVAINTDPEAAIFKDARFGIVGDYRKVIPALVEALRK